MKIETVEAKCKTTGRIIYVNPHNYDRANLEIVNEKDKSVVVERPEIHFGENGFVINTSPDIEDIKAMTKEDKEDKKDKEDKAKSKSKKDK